MSDPLVAPEDLQTYLGQQFDGDSLARAAFVLALAQQQCEAVVSPLPAGAQAVILDVAQRAFSNPSNAQNETAGPFSVNRGSVGGGLWLTRQNIAALRRLSGGGGAFTIDTTPAAFTPPTGWWDLASGVATGDFDAVTSTPDGDG